MLISLYLTIPAALPLAFAWEYIFLASDFSRILLVNVIPLTSLGERNTVSLEEKQLYKRWLFLHFRKTSVKSKLVGNKIIRLLFNPKVMKSGFQQVCMFFSLPVFVSFFDFKYPTLLYSEEDLFSQSPSHFLQAIAHVMTVLEGESGHVSDQQAVCCLSEWILNQDSLFLFSEGSNLGLSISFDLMPTCKRQVGA